MNIDKSYLKRVLILVLIVVAAIILLVDVVHFAIKRTENDYLTQFPDRVTIDLTDRSDALIVRNEFTVDPAPEGQTVLYLVTDGERVEKGAALAYVYPFSDHTDIVADIAELDDRIRLCTDIIHESGMYTLPKLTKLIDETLSEIDNRNLVNSFGQIETLQHKLDVYLSIREIRMGNVTVQKYEQELNAVQGQREDLLRSLGTPQKIVTAPEPGYFYRTCDGYEDAFSFVGVTGLDVSEYDAIVRNAERSSAGLGKIVRTYSWYAVCKVSAAEVQHYAAGKNYSVDFANEPSGSVTMRLSHIACEYGADSALLVFASDFQPGGFSYERTQHVAITYESHEGYAIPTTAVRVKDGVQGVYVLMGYRVLFRQINPIYEKDGLILADQNIPENSTLQPLNFYDNMIVKGTELHVDKIIE